MSTWLVSFRFPSMSFLSNATHDRNASLGHGDTDDRTHPEQVVLRRHDEDPEIHGKTSFKLQPALVRDVHMSKLHTGTANFSSLAQDLDLLEALSPSQMGENCPSDQFLDSCTYGRATC